MNVKVKIVLYLTLMCWDLLKYLFLLSINYSPNAFILLSVYVSYSIKIQGEPRQYESIHLVSCNTFSLKPLNRIEISYFSSAVTSRITAACKVIQRAGGYNRLTAGLTMGGEW